MRSLHMSRLAVAVVSGALVLAGCAGGNGADQSSATPSAGAQLSKEEIYVQGVVNQDDSGTPREGGTLTVIDYGEARSLDPTKTIPNGAVGGNALAAVYDTLLRYDTVNDAVEPQLAESISTEDNVTWTLRLREGVKFSDGTTLDAQSVVDSIRYFMDNKGFTVGVLAANIEKITPSDAHTVVFTLRRPWVSFPMMLTHGAGMVVAPAAIKGGPDAFVPIGAGPFMFEDYKPGEVLVLARNEGYFGDRPHLDRIRFQWVQGDQAKYDTLRAGDVDVISVRQASVLEEARQRGWGGIMNPVGSGTTIFVNNREGRPGANPKIRQAINAAIDPKAYLERSVGGAGLPSRNIYSKAYSYYQDVETAEPDLNAAKRLVAEAKEEGASTDLTYVAMGDPVSQAAAVSAEAMLEAAGFNVTLDTVSGPSDQTERIYVSHDFDLAPGALSVAEDPYTSFLTIVHSTSPSNPVGYSNPAMDALVDRLQASSKTEAKSVLKEINELWQESVPSVTVSDGGFFSPWQKSVHGIVPTSQNMMLFGKAWKE